MNFQKLAKVETTDKYLDFAFQASLKHARDIKPKVRKFKPISKNKNLELEKIKVMGKVLSKHLSNIVDSFPIYEELPDFYKELVRAIIDHNMLKKSLGSVLWATKQIKSLERIYAGKIRATKEIEMMKKHRRGFCGRVSSVMKQINKYLLFLENARKTMKSFPAVKTSLPTVAITGFPNVGKTTLLAKLTGSVAEIKSYAFTTKGINQGNVISGRDKVQVLDTPGTLNRVDKMNAIEYQMHLAVKHCADMIIYVFDLTETSYPIADQKKLYRRIKEYRKPVHIYLSKKDILSGERIKSFKLKHHPIEELKKLCLKLLKQP